MEDFNTISKPMSPGNKHKYNLTEGNMLVPASPRGTSTDYLAIIIIKKKLDKLTTKAGCQVCINTPSHRWRKGRILILACTTTISTIIPYRTIDSKKFKLTPFEKAIMIGFHVHCKQVNIVRSSLNDPTLHLRLVNVRDKRIG